MKCTLSEQKTQNLLLRALQTRKSGAALVMLKAYLAKKQGFSVEH